MRDRIYKFGKFELLAGTGELRTGDDCVRLQEKPLQLLIVLLENPQRLVTRAQLRERMWDTETFVDYELGINVAIRKIRDALGESAENPTFIQTVARKGYRFLVTVEVSSPEPTAPASAAPVTGVPQLPQAMLGSRRLVRRRWLLAALAIAMLAAVALWRFEFRAQQHRSTQIHSLAVLPLRNLSGDPSQEYLADGITEEIITDFAQSLPLRVISRTSVMRYKQTNQSITQIGRELGADAIVEGSVARSGNRVTVTVQLIDAAEDRHLWAQRFDRNMGELLPLEAELSQQIASQVGATLSSQRSIAATRPPADPQIHELCLMGRYHWNKRTSADLKKAAEYYQQAIARDPTYAPAYAGLADTYALMPSYDSVGMEDSYAKAAAAAHRALELDDSLAQAHATLGFIALNKRTAWWQAGPEFRRALEVNPNYATAHHWYAFYLFFYGRRNEALAEMDVAQQLDPLSGIIRADEAGFLYADRRYDEAKARLRQAIELAPDLGQPRETLALVYLETGHPSEALEEARAGLALDPENPRTLAETGYVLAITGHSVQAEELLGRLKKLVRRGASSPVYTAFIYSGLGQRSQAMAALEEADSCCGLQGLDQWHTLDLLQGEPRYQRLLAKVEEIRVSRSSSGGSAP